MLVTFSDFKSHFNPHRVLFHRSLTGTKFTIACLKYLGLEGGPPVFMLDNTYLALLVSPAKNRNASGLSPFLVLLSNSLLYFRFRNGLFRFRSPLLSESQLMFFPLGNEMFHFPKFSLIKFLLGDLSIRFLSLTVSFLYVPSFLNS